jgi:putative Ca2+/H+ antiporter (TMEM165/GDT1 family)
MDWKILIATFSTIFLAELGDKTQIAAIIMTSKTNKPLTVFIGSMIAFAVITIIGVAFGGVITKVIPIYLIKVLSAVAFITVGILILTGKL